MGSVAVRRMPLWSAVRRAWSWWVGELRGLVPARVRGERRRRVDARIRLERNQWLLIDRRGVRTPVDPQDAPLVMQRLEALKGRRKQVRVVVVVPLSRCFVRRTEVPRTMLGHAGSMLRSELDVATPFHGGSVHWDWFKHEDRATPDTVGITQVILKRRDTEPLIDRLAQAGVLLTRIVVEDDSTAPPTPLPIDLLRHDTDPAAGTVDLRKARRVLVGAAVLATLAIAPVAFSQQSSTLESLDGDLADARDAVALRPGLPRAPLEALGEAMRIKRTMPPVDLVLDRLAAILPPDSALDHLFLDNDVLTIQGSAVSIPTLERALAASPLFAAGHNTAPPAPNAERAPFTIRLKLKATPSPSET